MVATGGGAGAFGVPLFDAVLKRSAEDFVVHELLDTALDGAGEHVWLHVEKRGLDTWAVRDALAQAFGVTEREVGHSGLKDRHAITRQWLGVHAPGAEAGDAEALQALAERFEPGALRVLGVARHSRKLRIGTHRGNAFRIVLHGCSGPAGAALDEDALQRRAEAVRTRGCPNRFGDQRFGRDGDNVRAARTLLGPRARRVTRRRRGLLFSAARSYLFNRVLDARIERDDWHRLLPGEPAMLAGSRSLFVPDADDADIAARLAALDVSPTGPLPGRGTSMATGACARLEADLLVGETALIDGLAAAGVDLARRALRVAVPDLAVQVDPGAARITFTFSLPPGSFATVLLDQFGRCAAVAPETAS